MRTLRVATRRSALALAQSRAVGEELAALTGRRLELVEVTTRGDIDQAPLARIGGTGVFVAAVREALADGRADVAVHSLKDLPTAPDPRLDLAAVPVREDPRDALVTRSGSILADLPPGARVGTGSPRRRAQLVAARPDLEVVDIRGNVDTRLARVGADLDGVVLAAAGLARLGRSDRISEYLDPALVTPAPGQGALAVEVRAEPTPPNPRAQADPADEVPPGAGADAELRAALRVIDDPRTRAAVTAERTLLATLGVGCSAPVGALATVAGGPDSVGHLSAVHLRAVHLRAVMARPDGSLVQVSASGPILDAAELGHQLALDLLADPATATLPHPEMSHPAMSDPAMSHPEHAPPRQGHDGPAPDRGSPPR